MAGLEELTPTERAALFGKPNSGLPDLSLFWNGTWLKGEFTVPMSVSEERVRDAFGKYQQSFAEKLEWKGYQVLRITEPSVEERPWVEPDRRRYIMYAWCRKRPHELTIDLPDKHVPLFQKYGWKLKE